VLARLEDDEQRLEHERALALAAQARAEYERAQKAAAGQLISQHDLEVARARERAARADAERAALELERCTLRAPVPGIVRLARAEPNAVVQEGEELFRVAETRRLKGDLYLPPALRGRVSAGDAVTVTPLADPSLPAASGRVRMVNPTTDPVTGLFHVEVELPAGPGLGPGMDVRVTPRGAEPGRPAAGALAGAVLPRGAYVERSGDSLFVYRVRAGAVRRCPVTLGETGPDGFAVLSGLAPGDLVVESGQTPPVDGARARARVRSGSRLP
jgi:RND family efflux transporter MFP subunit